MTAKLKQFLLCLLCMIFLQSPFLLHSAENPADDNISSGIRKFLYALKLIRQHYVDGDKVSYKNLFELALQGLLKELDPYSAYETEEIFNKTQNETRGEKVGIGVYVILRLGSLEILNADPESPAEKAGLKPGDMIREIDGEPVNGKKLNEAASLLQGEAGVPVNLKLYRPSTDKHMELTVERQKLRIRSITGAKILDQVSGTGYLRINQFSQHTAEELDKALAELKKKNLKQLIIDLRGNPGGLVTAAVQTCSRFLQPETTVVSLIGRNEKVLKRFTAEKCLENWQDLSLVLLVNGATASAAEIMTACLRDYKRAVVIGEQTFGKGVVQNLIPFGKKEALRLTTAHYYSPSKQAIQGKGITPDIIIALTPARRFALAGQLNHHPGEIQPQIRNAVRDIQLERAVEVLKAVKLFRDIHPDKTDKTKK